MLFGKALKFRLERWIQRGVFHQLLFVATLIVSVAVLGGLVASLATDRFANAFEAIWWAFLRLTDPGYLGDDEGAVLRVISTVVTVLGYVLFMGSMIAIMTQWLVREMRNLEAGLTPVSMRDHVVILGWTNRTAEVVRQLMSGKGRLARFLEQCDVNKLRVVVQADNVDVHLRLALHDHLGEYWNENRIFLRSADKRSKTGSSGRPGARATSLSSRGPLMFRVTLPCDPPVPSCGDSRERRFAPPSQGLN